MSKKVNATIEAATTATKSLKEYFEQYPNVSLRKLAQATEISYGVLLKRSKAPIPGEPYDPEATNWASVEAKLTEKEINLDTLDWDAMNVPTQRAGATLEKNLDAFQIGDKVYTRRDATVPYEIVYKTATHIVVMKEGTSEPQAWSNNTFLMQGPSKTPRAKKITAEEAEEA